MSMPFLSQEPVAYASLARVILVALGAFGLQLSGEQIAAAVVVIEAVSTFVTRAQVTPVGSSDLTGVTSDMVVPDVDNEAGA